MNEQWDPPSPCEHLYCRGHYRCAPFYRRWVFNVLYALRIIE
jgi:hypothetical protein